MSSPSRVNSGEFIDNIGERTGEGQADDGDLAAFRNGLPSLCIHAVPEEGYILPPPAHQEFRPEPSKREFTSFRDLSDRNEVISD